VIVLLLLAKAALQAAGPFLGDGIGKFPELFLVSPCPSLTLEISADVIAGGELPIFVGGVYGIGASYSGFDLGQALALKDGILEAVALMEGIEAKVFDKTDPIDLELIDLGPELDLFGFFAAYDGPDIVLIQAHDAGFGFYPFIKVSVLLAIDLFGCGPSPVLVLSHSYCVFCFQAVKLVAKLTQ
jgi:hypothetical protein